jgi:hypothetical protein
MYWSHEERSDLMSTSGMLDQTLALTPSRWDAMVPIYRYLHRECGDSRSRTDFSPVGHC